jgi:PAS domain S-box-containing protein
MVLFSVVAALIMPLGYFVISYEHLMGVMETEAEINSKLVSGLVNSNPELWNYETLRLEELLANRPRAGTAETRRIFDRKNILVAESVNMLWFPQVKASHKIMDGDVTVGRIEINRSILPILLKSAILAIFGLGFGLLLYRWLPFQAVISAGKKLQDANDFLKKVMEGSTNSLAVIDLTGNIQMFNRRFEALIGVPQEKLPGSNFCTLFSDDVQSKFNRELGDVMSGTAENSTFETSFSRRDGLELTLFCGAVPLFTEGTISGVVVSLDDITERISAEEARMELERQLQQTQRLESLGVLAGGIAHDFNNILTIILGYCHVIKDEIDSTPDHAEYVQKIEDAAIRAADLCRQMMMYAGRNEMEHSATEMNLLVNEIVKMLHSGIKKNVTIELDLCDVLLIVADSSQIQQIVMNLIINAAEAIGDNNGTIRVALKKAEFLDVEPESDFTGRAIPPGNYVCLEVSDNGCGMDKETLNRIFEPFYTTKFEGRGLGMSSTLGIIKSHDGALQLSSRPGAGTTFKIYLPLPAESDSVENLPKTAQIYDTTGGSGKILLVDDEDELRILGPIRLNRIGYSAITAANGLEALRIYREQEGKIDLILLDLLMPEMDGVETYHRIREVSMTIPIVFCSGCSKKELSSDILDNVHTGFLKKPYNPDQLRMVLMEMLG